MKETLEPITPISRGEEYRAKRALESKGDETRELFAAVEDTRRTLITYRAVLEVERRKPLGDQNHALIAELTRDLSVLEITEGIAMEHLIANMDSQHVLQMLLERYRSQGETQALRHRVEQLVGKPTKPRPSAKEGGLAVVQ